VSVLRFESEEALRFTITSGLVPETVLASPARTWPGGGRAIVVAPEIAVPAATLKKLAEAGVGRETARSTSDAATRVRCWAEIIGVRREGAHRPGAGGGEVPDIGQVLFVLPDGQALCDLAAELLRLGCDRLEWRVAAAGSLLRVESPPYYTLLRAMDEASGIRAFEPSPKGQERVYVEVGYVHPLARLLRPEPGHTLLVSPSPGEERARFTMLEEGAFSDLYTLVDLTVGGPAAPRALAAMAAPPRLAVTLRLARAAPTDVPTLWVLREEAIRKVERLLASLPEETARGLLFSPCRVSNETMVVLRSRTGTRTTLEIDAEPYRAHHSIPNLYLPCDATLEPPLRRDRVRELLAPDPDAVVWLRSLGEGQFQVEHLPDAAFLPLTEWVEYVIDTSAPALEPWVKSCTFDFAAFVGEAPISARTREEPEGAAEPPRRRTNSAPQDSSPPAVRAPSRGAAPRIVARAALGSARLDPNVDAVQLAELEREFLALDTPGDAPVRQSLWERMAALNSALGRRHDATLCWTRALWELPADRVCAAAAAWATAERLAVDNASMQTLLALDPPGGEHVPALAAMTVAAQDEPRMSLAHDASLWLDRHDAALDMRTAWLARVALSRLAGGDRLGLARARDRLLGRIHRGLSVERDVPAFLRRAGAGRDAAQVEILAEGLAALLARFDATKRKRSATEADPKLTGAYVRLVVACGAARLGRREWATELRDAALSVLPMGDPVHSILGRAFAARVGHALEALPAETPLPQELWTALDALDKPIDRYKVDRVRQFSKIFEPQERLDPSGAFTRGVADLRGPEFAALRGVVDGQAIADAAAQLMKKARASTIEERARLYDGVMDFFLMIAHERAMEFLEELVTQVDEVPPLRRVELLEEALMLAGQLGEVAFARKIFAMLEPLLASVGPDGAAEIAPLIAGMLRTLRRFGLTGEAGRLLTATQAAATGKEPSHLVARLHTASGLAYLGDLARAKPVFDEVLAALSSDLKITDRLNLTRAAARALGTTPLAYAVAGLEQLQAKLDFVTDSYTTNSHLCVSVLDFMEGLVLGYASDDLTIGPKARTWLDEDEYLLRRRIHRDLTATG